MPFSTLFELKNRLNAGEISAVELARVCLERVAALRGLPRA